MIDDLSGEGVTTFVTTHHLDEAEHRHRLAPTCRGELIACGTPDELRDDSMGEDLIEIECERPQDALDLPGRVPGVREVALSGRGLRAVAEQGVAASGPIRVFLEGRCLHVGRAEVIEPSLGDVFVSPIGARDRAGQARREVAR